VDKIDEGGCVRRYRLAVAPNGGPSGNSSQKTLWPSRFAFMSFAFLLLVSTAHAQVVFDSVTSFSGQLTRTSPGNSLTFSHTTTGTNLLMVVGVSMNISGRNTTTVSGVTYNGVALTSAGTAISITNRRTELWYLIAPATGTHNVVVTLSVPGFGNPIIGTVAGAATFTGADQTTPIRTYVTNSGTSANAFVNVASSSNDMVLDTLALFSGTTAASTSPVQTQQWAISTGASGSDVYGFGSTRPGSASVPMSEDLSASATWAVAAVSVQSSQADLSVSVAGSTTKFPANVTYTATVKNNGPSGATGVVATLTLPSGLTLVSATPSQGSACSGTTTISCSLGTIANNGTATVSVVAQPTAPGGYPLTASVSASSADLNNSDNSASAVSYSEFTSCATTTVTAGGNLTGVINTYYPGTATAAAGSTSITLGASTGSGTAISAGDLVLIMQMQDAAINSSNSSQYGDGVSGSGSTNLNNSGVYEYATAGSGVPTTGGTLTVTAAGPGGGLLYTYTAAAASASQGARTFQVIRVPNYASATLTSGLTASPWNGATGGVLAVNVSGTLTMGGATISVNGLGFRGAAGLQLTGNAPGATTSDYLFSSPAAYTTAGAPFNGADGSKGEGIAGTPHWLQSGANVISSAQTYVEGYPSGSMAQGAPGNAGGGATDGDPASGNDENSGGGGGANGGEGGHGGNTWNSNLSSGGQGGTAFPASSSRVVMGGGGGAGSRNNSPADSQASSGAPGGGIVMIRAATISGNVTITANGSAAYNATANDGGGGGGAGGSIVLLWSAVTGTPNVALTATGGRGGDAWDAGTFTNANRHGPGGGGSGGAVLYSGVGAAIVTPTVTGGASGITLNSATTPYGATNGDPGVSITGVTLDSSPGPRSSAACTDVSITKSASPNPVIVNNTLTYTITVKNNSATTAASTVSVVDTIPSQVTYVSSSIAGGTGGACSQASGVLTCTFTSLAANASAVITVRTTATVPYTLAVNTVIVNSQTADPVSTNNTATVSVPIEGPTSVRVNSFLASQSGAAVLLSWNTGGELHNLGFNVYRDTNGQKAQLNPSLIAGSALLMREALEQHGAKTYGWIDASPAPGALYWLEDVDLNGTRTMHGPVSVQAGAPAAQPVAQAMIRAATLQNLAQPALRASLSAVTSPAISVPLTRVREAIAKPVATPMTQQAGFELAARPAVKILIDHEGWYRVTQPQLLAAGLNPRADARSLHLFAEGVEQPMRVVGGDTVFGPQSAIEFYGTAIDTPYSGQRVYWLVSQGRPGQRIATVSESGTAGPPPNSFWQTIELKPRTTYFAALLREDTDNFFGPLVSPATSTQTFNIANLSQGEAVLDIVLQGVIDGQQHDVTVALNGSTLGDVNFIGQTEGKARLTVSDGVLVNGTNTITLTAQQGSNDISVVDYIDVSYRHTYTAEADQLKFSANAGAAITVTGFSQPPTRLVDITNPLQPFAVVFQTSTVAGTYSLSAQVPWTSSGTHWLLALADTQIGVPFSLLPHTPSNLHSVQRGAEIVMLTAPQFAQQVQSLAALRRAEGKSVAVVNVDDVYDEFNFGERTPYAIRNFLRTASTVWTQKPHYLLLGGDASVDPRNYLGFGYLDFVPTKIVVTSELKTASDDWFSDFNNSGFAQIATGRLPVRTTADAQALSDKILNYASGQPGSWTNQSMVVADIDDPGLSFSHAAQAIQSALPASMNVAGIYTSTVGISVARQQILSGINAGQLLVNYNGHGSVEIWGNNLFDNTAASALNNGTKLPFVIAMNCLNGFFHDVYTESLATALMLSRNGGAVAVWASSGLTAPSPQFQMDQALVRTLSNTPGISLGNAVLLAKSGIGDQDVRRTFILFGDPSMGLKWPQAPASVVNTNAHILNPAFIRRHEPRN
jgi:uncharacterized repeat protein (TIGR01451 family)